jgi:hypothetical protein
LVGGLILIYFLVLEAKEPNRFGGSAISTP